MSRWRLFVPLVLFLALAAFFLYVQLRIQDGQYDPQNMPSALLDRPVPDFQLPELHSGQLVGSELVAGKPALLNVWATWCPSCVYEHPFLNQLKEEGVITIIGVNYKDEDAAARRWLSEKGDPYTAVVVDADGRLGLDLGVTGAPETYLVDASGRIRLRYQGPLDERVWQAVFAPQLQAMGQTTGQQP